MPRRDIALIIVAVLAASLGALISHFYWQPAPDWFRFRDVAKVPSAELIRYGRELIEETELKIGPDVADASLRYAGNNMNCGACHLNGGVKKFGLPLIDSFATFPRYFEGRPITLEDRINLCMMRSMNGKPLPHDSREMSAFVAYIKFLGTGTPVGVEIDGMGVQPLSRPAAPASAERGEVVYREVCSTCHGADGEGQRRGPDPAAGYTVTPLWGPQSFNSAAGMNNPATLAAFAHDNMPYGVDFTRPLLSVQQAWDVAAFIAGRPRPEFRK
ncbi:MAG: c-type cytochrome [Alphaproteobacteria bacterium]